MGGLYVTPSFDGSRTAGLIAASYAVLTSLGKNVYVNIAKAKFAWAKIRKMQSMDIKRSQLFQNCRGKYFSKTEELFSILELLEEYGYLKIVRPEYQGTGRPADVHILVNPAAVS